MKDAKPTLKLSDLKKSLSECHLTSVDRSLKLLLDPNLHPSFYLHRIMECVQKCQDEEDVQENTKLGIQLFNLFRVRANERLQSEREQTDRARIENPDSDNNGTPGSGMAGDSDARERVPDGPT